MSHPDTVQATVVILFEHELPDPEDLLELGDRIRVAVQDLGADVKVVVGMTRADAEARAARHPDLDVDDVCVFYAGWRNKQAPDARWADDW